MLPLVQGQHGAWLAGGDASSCQSESEGVVKGRERGRKERGGREEGKGGRTIQAALRVMEHSSVEYSTSTLPLL